MAKFGIFYGSSTGNTQQVAEYIKASLNVADEDFYEASEAKAEDLAKYDVVICGSSTWGVGDLQDDFQELYDNLDSVDLSGKKVAVFGTGDSSGFADSFVDSIGVIAEKLVELGGELVGMIDKDGYDYEESRAEKDGKLLGLAIDDSMLDDAEEKVQEWVKNFA